MFWTKKPEKVEEPQPPEREFEIIARLIQSMEEHPDSWHAKSNYSGKPTFTRTERKTGQINLVAVALLRGAENGHSAKVSFNEAEVEITEISKRRLVEAGEVLIREKLLRSLVRADELSDRQ